jgi:excisionase family DNA binding protein
MALLSLKEAAERLSISPHTLTIWTKKRRLPHVRMGKLYKYRSTDVERFIRDSLVKAGKRA